MLYEYVRGGIIYIYGPHPEVGGWGGGGGGDVPAPSMGTPRVGIILFRIILPQLLTTGPHSECPPKYPVFCPPGIFGNVCPRLSVQNITARLKQRI